MTVGAIRALGHCKYPLALRLGPSSYASKTHVITLQPCDWSEVFEKHCKPRSLWPRDEKSHLAGVALRCGGAHALWENIFLGDRLDHVLPLWFVSRLQTGDATVTRQGVD